MKFGILLRKIFAFLLYFLSTFNLQNELYLTTRFLAADYFLYSEISFTAALSCFKNILLSSVNGKLNGSKITLFVHHAWYVSPTNFLAKNNQWYTIVLT